MVTDPKDVQEFSCLFCALIFQHVELDRIEMLKQTYYIVGGLELSLLRGGRSHRFEQLGFCTIWKAVLRCNGRDSAHIRISRHDGSWSHDNGIVPGMNFQHTSFSVAESLTLGPFHCSLTCRRSSPNWALISSTDGLMALVG